MQKDLDTLRAKKLAGDETLVFWIKAFRGDDALSGMGFITDRRVGYFRRGTFGEKFETIGLEKVSSVEMRTLLGFQKVTIHTSNDSLVLRMTVPKGELDRFVSEIENRKGPGTRPAPAQQPVTQSVSDDPLTQLERLGKLRDASVITPEEFNVKKAELLARL